LVNPAKHNQLECNTNTHTGHSRLLLEGRKEGRKEDLIHVRLNILRREQRIPAKSLEVSRAWLFLVS